MRTTELFRSCANEYVAAAALACIGGRLERRVAVGARRAGLSVGAFVAELVTNYDRKASPNRRRILEMGMVRHDTPLLAGLRHVVETALDGAWDGATEYSGAASPVGMPDSSSRFPWRVSPRSEPRLRGPTAENFSFPDGNGAKIRAARPPESFCGHFRRQMVGADWRRVAFSVTSRTRYRLSRDMRAARVGPSGPGQRNVNAFILYARGCAAFRTRSGRERRLRNRECLLKRSSL